MNNQLLRPETVLYDRPFTHPSHTEHDKRQLCYMLLRLSQVLNTIFLSKNPNLFAPESHELFESDGRHHRIIPIRPKLLQTATSVTVVGFFGQRQIFADVSDGEAIASRDKMLFSEMKQHTGLLSYSSLEMTNGDYGNCVLFADEKAKDDWGYSQVHAEAVKEMSPKFYSSVRLYNGEIQGSAFDIYKLQLSLVKYFDYETNPPWHGVRKLDESRQLAY